ncbi:MAG: Outer rane efflux protein [Candidatus Dadabacteria bacterium]|nr:Outer rane efflux protein [Candidatus Dadabacteria bacterium]
MRALFLLLILSLSTLSISSSAQETTETLTLDKALEIALENNPTLEASRASVDIMKARVQGARSDLFPQIKSRFIYPFVGTESGVSLDQLIWDFGYTSNIIKATKAQVKSSEYDKVANREDVILDTKIAYYTVLAQKRIVEASEKKFIENERRLEQAEGFFKVGRISKIEITKAKVNLGNAKLNLVTAKNNLERAKLQLSTAMGIIGNFNYELEDMLEYKMIDVNLEQAIGKAFELRRELDSLEAKKVAMKANLKASKQDYYPTIFGRTAYRIKGEGATQPGFIAGIGVQFPIFEGFSTISEINEAKADLRRSQAEIESMKGQILSEVKQSYLNLKLSEESIKVTETSKTSSEENLELARERYRLGRASSIELAEAEALYASTNADYIQVIYNYKIAVAQLERAIGEKLEE